MKHFLKKAVVAISITTLLTGLTGCTTPTQNQTQNQNNSNTTTSEITEQKTFNNTTTIELSDETIMVDGNAISTDTQNNIYVAKDIVFYLEGQDFTYGEGTKDDAHSQEEADKHTVVHITEPGTYAISGTLSSGQIAIDLGEEAKENKDAIVTLILNNVNIDCSVAPAIIFYNVYECGNTDTETASKDVDTTTAGANVIIADNSVNNINGSYVARIYKSVELNEDGTEVVNSKKLHKYDAAFYSKMTMNVNGETEGNGILNITAKNEGLDSELHLTINGGNINIISGNDGINTNEDKVSVTTINDGTLKIKVSGETGEGDGIDSNGWLVINGGTIIAEACSTSGDAGIDSDMGIHINGGTVIATGNMLDRISESTQNYAVFNFASKQNGGTPYTFKNEANETIFEHTTENNFSYLIYSSDKLANGTYTFWQDNTQLVGTTGNMIGGMQRPEGIERPNDNREFPKNAEMPENITPPEGTERPDDNRERPEGTKIPENGKRPQREYGNRPENSNPTNKNELSTEFIIKENGNYFTNISIKE